MATTRLPKRRRSVRIDRSEPRRAEAPHGSDAGTRPRRAFAARRRAARLDELDVPTALEAPRQDDGICMDWSIWGVPAPGLRAHRRIPDQNRWRYGRGQGLRRFAGPG